jgi:dihydroxy-acid dehydratase
MALLEKDIKPKDIITYEALANAMKVNSAIGGSTNAVLHLLAIAYEGRIELVLDDFNEIAATVPHLVPMIPSGAYTLLDFYEAGGVPGLMKQLSTCLDFSAMSCTTKTIGENLHAFEIEDEDVIRPLSNPVHHRGGIAVLRGNIAPDGSITKPSAIPEAALTFTGPARIFESEEEALKGIRSHKIKEGDVLVIRNEGPKGGPGMPEMYKAMKILVGMGLGETVCVITDGRFSGSNNGCFVGHICPEAYDDGPIAYLQDGDTIRVDVPNRSIETLDVDFDKRRKTMTPNSKKPVEGVLYQYRRQVRSSSEGAVIPTRD